MYIQGATIACVANSRLKGGFLGVLGNKGTLAKYGREQGNISQFWEQGNKTRKITLRKHSENVWEHGNIVGREQGNKDPPWETLIKPGASDLDRRARARSVMRGKNGEDSLSCVCFCRAPATQAS